MKSDLVNHSQSVAYRGHVFTFCEAGLRLFLDHTWRVSTKKSGHVYLLRSIYVGKKNGRSIYRTSYFHRELLALSAGDKLCADHISGDTTDNRLENLRAVSYAANASNRRLKTNGALKTSTGWIARPVLDGRPTYLGFFKDKALAEATYSVAVQAFYGHAPRVTESGSTIRKG